LLIVDFRLEIWGNGFDAHCPNLHEFSTPQAWPLDRSAGAILHPPSSPKRLWSACATLRRDELARQVEKYAQWEQWRGHQYKVRAEFGFTWFYR
jgi:hypothetical protein